MAKQIKLAAQTRTHVGRSAVRKIKQQGFVPGVIYGAKQEALAIQLSAREVSNVLAAATSEHLVVELEIADAGQTSTKLAIIQEVQHHPLRRDVLHVDFHAVSADEKIHAAVPIETIGTASGVKNYGGILETSVHELEVECLPKDLPEVIRIDVTALGLNDAIHIRDLQLPEGVTARGDEGLTVVRVAPPTVAEVETSAGAAAVTQPEVIKEKKEDAEKK